ncbi:type VI secretion system-associated FHA domain protein TagH [Tolumonas auensis]|uniref:type VI secretion system-associated FHA domain protein TagH n=1 Tax=Tolumonas auensis TaxID=43948 RepID=UPI002AA7A649|nr:type VI secretion system-associated FHA domain protein TagH [Tolumonas auensis]
MPLILDLINAEGQSSAQKSSVTFRNAGGTIGRADSATWMLTDRSRHISGVHAEISYEEGVYYLTDRSTNGIYDVAKNARLQKNEDYPITHGDRFRMGSFIFKARVLQDADHFEHQIMGEPSSVSALIPDDEFLDTDPLAMLNAPEIPSEDFELGEFSVRRDDNFALNESFDDLDEPFLSPTLASVPLAQEEQAMLAALDISNPIPVRPVPLKPEKTGSPVAGSPASAHAPDSAQRVLQVLGSSMDFDFGKLTQDELDSVLQNLGVLTKHAVQGLQQVLRTRADIKNKLRLGSTMVQESGNNPLKLSGNYTQTLNCMLLGQIGYLSGPQAVRQALKDIQAHQVSCFAASQTILDSVFEQFSPTQLVYRFETAGKPGKWGSKDAYYWQQYQLHHQKMSGDQEWRQSQFIKDYARVYEEQEQYINAAWSELDAR